MKVILLAAGVGRRFGPQTKKTPKCLIPLGKNRETLLSRYFESFRELGLKRIVVVVGHQKEKVKKACKQWGQGLDVRFIANPRYKKGSIVSLYSAREALDEDCLIMDADVFFPTEALSKLINSKYKTCFLVDRKTKSTGEEMLLMLKGSRPVRISKTVDRSLKILGESIGFLKICRKDGKILKKILEDFIRNKKLRYEYEESYCELLRHAEAGYESVGSLFWTEMDFREDLEKIRRQTLKLYC